MGGPTQQQFSWIEETLKQLKIGRINLKSYFEVKKKCNEHGLHPNLFKEEIIDIKLAAILLNS